MNKTEYSLAYRPATALNVDFDFRYPNEKQDACLIYGRNYITRTAKTVFCSGSFSSEGAALVLFMLNFGGEPPAAPMHRLEGARWMAKNTA